MKNTLQLIGEWLALKFNKIESIFATKDELKRHNASNDAHKNLKDDLDGIKDGSITAGNSEYAEKLGNEEDFYTKLLLDQKIDGHINNVTYNPDTAAFTFYFENGATKEIDTVLESTVKDGRFDAETDELILVLISGHEIRIPISKFIKKELMPIVLHATSTTNATTGRVIYKLNNEDRQLVALYFDEKKSAPVALRVISNDDSSETVYLMEKTEVVSGRQFRMIFLDVNSSNINRLWITSNKLSSGAWTSPTMSFSQIEYSEYEHDRYIPTESFDMNDWFESGGISAYLYEAFTDDDGEEYPALEGANIPDGFTNFFGFVLANEGYGGKRTCATQVVTDAVLKKTMIRSSYYSVDVKGVEWTPWTEIGGSSGNQEKEFNTLVVDLTTLDFDYPTIEDGVLNEILAPQIAGFDFEKPCKVIFVEGDYKYVCDGVYTDNNSSAFTIYAEIPNSLKADFKGEALRIQFNKNSQVLSRTRIIDQEDRSIIFLKENGDGMLNAVDGANWSTFAEQIETGATPVVYLKTKNSGIYAPASYEFVKNEETNKYPGKIEITYYKTIGEQKGMFIESYEFSDSPSLGSIYTHHLSQMPVGAYIIELAKDGDNYSVANTDILPAIIEAFEGNGHPNILIKDSYLYIATDFIMSSTGGIVLSAINHLITNTGINIKNYLISIVPSTAASVVVVSDKNSMMFADNIHLVSEYPTSLANYPDGSIFIKQQ